MKTATVIDYIVQRIADEGIEHCFGVPGRSEEHTSELQSRSDLVCRLLLEKKKKRKVRYVHLTSTTTSRVTPPAPVQYVTRTACSHISDRATTSESQPTSAAENP